MALDFPGNPVIGQSYTLGNRTWEWNGTGWQYQVTEATPPQAGVTEDDVIALNIALS